LSFHLLLLLGGHVHLSSNDHPNRKSLHPQKTLDKKGAAAGFYFPEPRRVRGWWKIASPAITALLSPMFKLLAVPHSGNLDNNRRQENCFR